MTLYEFFIRVLKDTPRGFVFICVLCFIAGGLELISLAAILPVLMNLLDASSQTQGAAFEFLGMLGLNDVSLYTALGVILVMMSMRGVLLLYADYVFCKISRDIEVKMRIRLLNGFLKARWDFLAGYDRGKAPNTMLRETEKASLAIQRLGMLMASFVISFCLIGSTVFVSWQAFAIFIVAVIPYLVISKWVHYRIGVNARLRIEQSHLIGRQTGESTAHLKYAKTVGLENHIAARFKNAVTEYARYYLYIVTWQSFIKFFPEVFGVLILGILVYVTHDYLNTPPADLIFFILLLFRGYRQIAQLQGARGQLAELMPSYTACLNMIEETEAEPEDRSGHLNGDFNDKGIKLDNVTFHYPSRSEPTLSGITLTVPKRGLIALVGKSGAGKTTISDLLTCLLTPTGGRITVGGNQDLKDIDKQKWRENIGYVPQDIFLTNGTVRDNILIGAKDQSRDNLENAIRVSGLQDFIDNLENGYDTDVGDGGMRFSGGQRQRIALTRALARNPDLIILDEATSALDNETEKIIKHSINDLAKDRSIVVIAHRLSTIQNADTIYVLDNGKIVEDGPYDDLMKNRGAFYNLYRKGL